VLGGRTQGDAPGIAKTLLVDDVPDLGRESEEGENLALWKWPGRMCGLLLLWICQLQLRISWSVSSDFGLRVTVDILALILRAQVFDFGYIFVVIDLVPLALRVPSGIGRVLGSLKMRHDDVVT
jgi:hypothetical protein